VIATSDVAVAFKDIDVAALVGAMPRKEGMERKDLLEANVKIFKEQGEALSKYAKKSVKVLVVGNPANTNALICSKYAKDIPAKNFTALTRLDQNRAQAQVASFLTTQKQLPLSCEDVVNVTIWGNHSSTQFPDVRHASVVVSGARKPALEVLQNEDWVNNEFVATVQKRGAAVIAARKLSSAMSAAKAICDHLRDWLAGTAPDTWVSMGVISDGNTYGVPEGLIYSFPVKIAAGGEWQIVENLEIDTFSREKMEATAKELLEEREMALAACTQA